MCIVGNVALSLLNNSCITARKNIISTVLLNAAGVGASTAAKLWQTSGPLTLGQLSVGGRAAEMKKQAP